MKLGPKLAAQANGQRSRESKLLAEVEFFREELGSIVPYWLNNTKYRMLLRCLDSAALELEYTLRHSDDAAVPLNEYQSSQKLTFLENSERYFNELRKFKTEMTRLMESSLRNR
jgi:hypothetical protein